MRSVKSCSDAALLRSDVRRFWPVAAAYLLVWIVGLPLQLSQIGHYGTGATDALHYAAERVLDTLPASAIIACIVGCAMAMAVNSYMMSARAIGLMHSLPMTRPRQFLVHTGAALLMYTAANIAVVVLSALATLQAVPWAALGWWLLVTELMGFFALALGCLAATLTGWLLATPVVYALMQFGVIMITVLLRGLGSVFYYGYSGGELPEAVIWLTPVVKMFDACCECTVYIEDVAGNSVLDVSAIKPTTVVTALIYAAAGIALLALACRLYMVRRSESAGDVVAHKKLRSVVRYVGAPLCGIAGGLLLHEMLDLDVTACSVAVTALAYFAIEMLLKKTARVFRRGWKGALVVCAAAVLVCVCVAKDVTGYQTRVPAEEDVAAVQIRMSGLSGAADAYMEDEETIHAALMLHQRLVDEYSGAALPEPAGENEGYGGSYFAVAYKLKNGTVMRREYNFSMAQGGQLYQLFDRVKNSPQVQWHSVMGGLTPEETPLLGGAYVHVWGSEEDREISLDDRQATALYEAIRADLLAGRNASATFEEKSEELNVGIDFFVLSEQSIHFSGYVDGLRNTCTETVKALLALGLSEESLYYRQTYTPEETPEYTVGE